MKPVSPSFEPDPAQARVLAHGSGPMLVTGAPGTGKTAVLRERFARLIESGENPERVALVVGSKRARREARQGLLGRLRSSLPGLRILTLHGLAYHVVSQRYGELGYERPPEVLTAADQFSLVRELLTGEDPSGWPAYGAMLGLRGFADEVRQFLLRAQEALVKPAEVGQRAAANELTGWLELGEFYRRYLEILDARGQVDFAGLLEQAAAVAGKGQALFDHVLLDDYQDATFATERLLVELAPKTLVVGGDPGSHVFSFRGTTDVPIRRFTSMLPIAVEVHLDRDHRRGEQGAAIRAWTSSHTAEEHAAVARELRRIHIEDKVGWGQIAVVVRRQGSHLGGLLRALDDAGVPRAMQGGGLSLLAEPATHPFVLALRWLALPAVRDALVESLLTSDLVGLSPATARGLIRAAAGAGSTSAGALERAEGLTDQEAAAVRTLRDALARAELRSRSVTDAFGELWRSLPHAARLVREGEARASAGRSLDAVVAFSEAVARAGERSDPSVAAFLESLESGEDSPGLVEIPGGANPGSVSILTAHGTVGQEFDTVVVVGAVEGNFPSLSRPEPMFDLAALDRSIAQSERNRLRLQDERRLLRVVATRARRAVLFTASDPHGQDEVLAGRSRFVPELGGRWENAPVGPFAEVLSVREAATTWRRALADGASSRPLRLAAMDGLMALGVRPARWWFQRDWTGSDRPLHEHLRVSFSRLDTLENCALQFVLAQELGLETRSGYHAWVGGLVHKLIEDCEDGLIERTAEALVAEADRRWRQQEFPSFAVSEAFRRLVTQVMLPGWARDYGQGEALARELEFEFEFEGASVRGYIDRVGRAGNGVLITDYKTGRSRFARAEENLQLGIYYLALSRAEELRGFRPVKAVELAFLRETERGHPEVIKRASLGLTNRNVQEYEETMTARLAELIGRLQDLQVSENYRPNPQADCHFCEFKPLCPLWPEGRDLFPGASAVAVEDPEPPPQGVLFAAVESRQ